MNYMKFTVVMAAAIALTQYLEDQKILPNEGIVCSMALVAIMAGGAVINAFAFVGRDYLALFLSGYDPEASLEEKKTWHSFWGLLSRLRQIRKRKKETPWLDWNAARNQRADQAELYEHRLGLQTVQPGPPTGATHHSQWTHVLWVLPTQCSAKIRFDNFCRHRCSCAWIRRFSFFYIISFNQNSSSIRLSHCICFYKKNEHLIQLLAFPAAACPRGFPLLLKEAKRPSVRKPTIALKDIGIKKLAVAAKSPTMLRKSS